jgi:hypothetical protein
MKRGTAKWSTIKGFDLADSYVPFKAVTKLTDVRYLGVGTHGGKDYHKVSVPGALLIHPNTIPYNVRKEKIDEMRLELLIDDKGRPVFGTWHMRSQARVGPGAGQLQRLVYDLKLSFSKVGAKITVKRP